MDICRVSAIAWFKAQILSEFSPRASWSNTEQVRNLPSHSLHMSEVATTSSLNKLSFQMTLIPPVFIVSV